MVIQNLNKTKLLHFIYLHLLIQYLVINKRVSVVNIKKKLDEEKRFNFKKGDQKQIINFFSFKIFL